MACKVKKQKLWSQDNMERAVKYCKENHTVGLRETARRYNVPIETLRRKIAGITRMSAKPGRETVLTDEEEGRLVQYVIEMCDMGFGLTRQDVMRTAYTIATQSGREHPFGNGLTGRSWFDGLKFCHLNLTTCIAQPLS